MTHLIKEIKLHGHVFLHQMYAHKRFNHILKSFVRNWAYPEGRLTGKGTIGKKAITLEPNLFCRAHFHVLQ
jgi:hypothetical protein